VPGQDLPEFIEVDLGALKIGDSIHLGQLALPKGVKLAITHWLNPSLSASSARVALPKPLKAKLLPSNFRHIALHRPPLANAAGGFFI
jgi:hypothetical protein